MVCVIRVSSLEGGEEPNYVVFPPKSRLSEICLCESQDNEEDQQQQKSLCFIQYLSLFPARRHQENLEAMPSLAAWRICIVCSLRAVYGQS